MAAASTRRRALALLAATAAGACGPAPGAKLTAPAGGALAVMDFAAPPNLADLPPSWRHRTFWTRRAMTMSLGTKDGVAALRCATAGTASMLIRDVDLALADRPLLAWRWLVEVPIDSPLSELTREGDDHPARLWLAFATASGERRAMEIVWGNRELGRGDWKIIGAFPHYVANGGMEDVGRWHAEQVDLAAITARAFADGTPARIAEIGIFCDSDETRTRSVAWFAEIALKPRA